MEARAPTLKQQEGPYHHLSITIEWHCHSKNIYNMSKYLSACMASFSTSLTSFYQSFHFIKRERLRLCRKYPTPCLIPWESHLTSFGDRYHQSPWETVNTSHVFSYPIDSLRLQFHTLTWKENKTKTLCPWPFEFRNDCLFDLGIPPREAKRLSGTSQRTKAGGWFEGHAACTEVLEQELQFFQLGFFVAISEPFILCLSFPMGKMGL